MPSDSSFREDIAYFKAGELEQAQGWKDRIEDIEAGDQRRREEFGV